VDALREEMSRKIDTYFRWTIGILIAGIFSIITVILTLWLKL
jgi:predicted outer membrane lipoprotein